MLYAIAGERRKFLFYENWMKFIPSIISIETLILSDIDQEYPTRNMWKKINNK